MNTIHYEYDTTPSRSTGLSINKFTSIDRQSLVYPEHPRADPFQLFVSVFVMESLLPDRTYDLMVQITHFEKPPPAPAVSALAQLRSRFARQSGSSMPGPAPTSKWVRTTLRYRVTLPERTPLLSAPPLHSVIRYTQDFRYRSKRMTTAGQYGMSYVYLSGLPLRVWRRDEEGIDRSLDVPFPSEDQPIEISRSGALFAMHRSHAVVSYYLMDDCEVYIVRTGVGSLRDHIPIALTIRERPRKTAVAFKGRGTVGAELGLKTKLQLSTAKLDWITQVDQFDWSAGVNTELNGQPHVPFTNAGPWKLLAEQPVGSAVAAEGLGVLHAETKWSFVEQSTKAPFLLGVKAELNGQPHVPFNDVTTPPTLLQHVSRTVVFPKEQPENGFPPPTPGKVAPHFGSSEDIGDEEGDLQWANKVNAGEGKKERCITAVVVSYI
ncbi:hypothetical protein DFH09DRAFT_1111153 [Mycena vulgaris]|nr:hypothetical protein DFH09DRAFT_1111153 [Mycena vulgaris]